MNFNLSQYPPFSNQEITGTIQTLKSVSKQLGCRFFYCKLKKINQSVTWKDRLSLRKDLVYQLQKHYKNQESHKLLCLNWNPKNSIFALSIAHCPTLAGFVFSLDQKVSIGFDIELTGRLTNRVIQRISQAKELKQAPNKDLLWTAKESVCKCIGNIYKKKSILFKDCLISQWKTTNRSGVFFFSFQWKNLLNQNEIKTGRGSAFSKGSFTFGYAQTLVT